MMFDSVWKMSVSKDDFRRMMKQGDIDTEINQAKDMMKEEPEHSQRSIWLRDHVEKLTCASNTILEDDRRDAKSKFLKDNFEVVEEPFERVAQIEPDKDDDVGGEV